jgi:hypothetical protein
MRNRLPLLALPALALVSMTLMAPACLAQEHARDETPPADARAVDAQGSEASRKSAFGRVMAVMIEALQQETLRDNDPGMREVRTTAAGTPLGIEVGESFMLDQGRLDQGVPDQDKQQQARPSRTRPPQPAIEATAPPLMPARPLAVQAGGAG